MSDASSLVQTIAARWNAGLAEQAARQIAAQFWAAGQPSQPVHDLIDRMRQALKQQLARAASPVEQMRALEISYRFEQGIGNRGAALGLAKNLRHLSERKGDALHQVRSADLLGEAWYYVSAVPLAIEWVRRALQTAKPLEVRGVGGRPLKLLFATYEVELAWYMALKGGADEGVDKLMADAVQRMEGLNEAVARAAALGMWSRVRMLQARWAESVDYARIARQAAASLPNRAIVIRGLWPGARAAARVGDLATAKAWIEESIEASRQTDDVAACIAGTFSQSSILFLAGDQAAALRAADQAVALAEVWKMEILLRWAMLERSWVRLPSGQEDLEEMRATVESLAKAGAGPLEAEARYALYHALKAAGQDAREEYEKAREQFLRLKMEWHLAKAEKNEPLLAGPA